MLDFDRFEALTFDCYGTLIDWETGLVSTLGLSTVWVNRRKGREGFGATPPTEAEPDVEVPDLQTLATLANCPFTL